MAVLRRATSKLLTSTLAGCVLIGFVLGVIAAVDHPLPTLVVGLLAIVPAVVLGRGEGWATFGVTCAILVPLAVGAYALYALCGLSLHVVVWIAIGVAVLVVAVVFRAAIASGSADDPYDD